MKTCPNCNRLLQRSAFQRNSAKKDGLQSACRECRRIVDANRYVAEKASIRVVKQARRKRLSLALYTYLLSHPCVDCGEADPIVLEFDHVRGEKVDNVTNLARQGAAWHASKTRSRSAKCGVPTVIVGEQRNRAVINGN